MMPGMDPLRQGKTFDDIFKHCHGTKKCIEILSNL